MYFKYYFADILRINRRQRSWKINLCFYRGEQTERKAFTQNTYDYVLSSRFVSTHFLLRLLKPIQQQKVSEPVAMANSTLKSLNCRLLLITPLIYIKNWHCCCRAYPLRNVYSGTIIFKCSYGKYEVPEFQIVLPYFFF